MIKSKILKNILLISILFSVVSLLSACALADRILSGSDSESQAWNLLLDSAERTEVVMCVDPDETALIEWLDEEFASTLSSEYNITLRVVTQNIDKTFEKLQDDIDQERETGYYDIVVLDGDVFSTAMSKGYLYGPFTDKLPNVNNNLNSRDYELRYDEGIEIAGYEVPITKTQLIMINNEDFIYDVPETMDDLVDDLIEFKGQFIYPDPRTSTEGEAFVISIMAPYLDVEKAMTGDYTKDEITTLTAPAVQFLNQIEPYLYESGALYPSTVKEVDDLYRNGDLIFSMSLSNDYVTTELKTYEYPEESNSFMLPEGSTGGVTYVGIPATAPNKSSAMVTINALLSPESQADLFNPKYVGKLPVYDVDETPTEAMTNLKAVKIKSTTLSYDEVLPYRIPNFAPSVKDMLVAIWEENVLNETIEE